MPHWAVGVECCQYVLQSQKYNVSFKHREKKKKRSVFTNVGTVYVENSKELTQENK